MVADAVVVENLRITLPSGGGPRTLVDGVSFRLRAGEVLGIVGESGCGKTLTSLAIGQLLPHPLRKDGHQDRARRHRADHAAARTAGPGARHRPGHDLPGPDVLHEPGIPGRVAAHRRRPAAPRAVPRGGPGRGRAAARRGADRRRPAGAAPLPVPVLRRHAAADHDRHGPDGPAAGADRGRADHRAGRHRAGSGPRGAAGHQRQRGHRDHPDLAQPGRHQPAVRPGAGHVRRARGRGGATGSGCWPTRSTRTRRRCWPRSPCCQGPCSPGRLRTPS